MEESQITMKESQITMKESQKKLSSMEQNKEEFNAMLNKVRSWEKITEEEFVSFFKSYTKNMTQTIDELTDFLVNDAKIYKKLPFEKDILANLNK